MENERVMNNESVMEGIGLMGDPAAGTIRTKTTYIYDTRTMENIMDGFLAVFDRGDVNVFAGVIQSLISITNPFGYFITGIGTTSMLSTAAKINYSRDAYYKLQTAYRNMVNNRASGAIIEQKYVWEYQGMNKQYWKLTGNAYVDTIW